MFGWENTKCPKCGAPADSSHIMPDNTGLSGGPLGSVLMTTRFKCESFAYTDELVKQSTECRLTAIENRLKEIENERYSAS